MNKQQWYFEVDEHLFQNVFLPLSFVGRLTGIEERIEGIPFIVCRLKSSCF